MANTKKKMEKKNTAEDERLVIQLLDHASRVTKGKCLSKLLENEVQQDEELWSQDVLKEEKRRRLAKKDKKKIFFFYHFGHYSLVGNWLWYATVVD